MQRENALGCRPLCLAPLPGSQQRLTFQLLLLIVNTDNVTRSSLVNHCLFVMSLFSKEKKVKVGAGCVELPYVLTAIIHPCIQASPRASRLCVPPPPPGTALKTRTCRSFFFPYPNKTAHNITYMVYNVCLEVFTIRPQDMATNNLPRPSRTCKGKALSLAQRGSGFPWCKRAFHGKHRFSPCKSQGLRANALLG